MEKLWNGNYNRVLTGNFLMFVSFQMLVPLLPLYLTDRFGATKDEIGVVLAGYAVAALVIRPFSGFVVDSFDRKKVLLLCYFLFAAFFSGYLLAGSLLVFTIVRILHGAPFGATTVANSTAAIDVLPSSRRAEGIGYYGLSGNLAMAIGPVVGLSMYHNINNTDFIFWFCLISSFIGLVVMSKVKGLKKVQKSKANAIDEEQAEIVKNKKFLTWDRFFLIVAIPQAISILCFSFSYGVVSTYVAIYAREKLGVTGGTGLFFTLLAIGLIASRLQGAQALRQGRIIHNAWIGMIISASGFLLFALTSPIHNILPSTLSITPIIMYLSAFIVGLGNGHMYPAFQNMFISMAPNSRRGTANSTILISWDLGLGLGILLGGVVSEHLGYFSAFLMAWLINFVGLLIFLFLGKNHYLKNKIQ